MRVLVCGGREFYNRQLVYETLDAVLAKGAVALLHGGARGADSLAGCWARDRGIVCEEFPAQWELYGNKAGPRRNQQMLDTKPDLVIAFPGGAGTYDMVRRAKAAGVEVQVIA